MAQTPCLLMSRAFEVSLSHMAPGDRRRVVATIRKLLLVAPHYPGLHRHRIQSIPHGFGPIWEVYVTAKSLRLVYDNNASPPGIRLWLVGSHTVLDRTKHFCRSHCTFTPVTVAELEAPRKDLPP